MTKTQRIWTGMALVVLGLVFAGEAVQGAASTSTPPCVVPDNGTGTVTLPPAGCGYVSPDELHLMINGLPDGTTILVDVKHHEFFCRQTTGLPCHMSGGPLGGEVENFGSVGTFVLRGTGALAGWTRTLSVPLNVQTATAPRPAGPVQSFSTDMLRLQGSIANDADFALFEVVGGTDNGHPSPGQTTLTRLSDSSFKVDSRFQVGYQIRFVGAAGGPLAGYEGTTVGTVNMATGQDGPCN